MLSVVAKDDEKQTIEIIHEIFCIPPFILFHD
jgi:hypothetical protein